MKNFTVDPRDGYSSGGSCNTCCCALFHMKPGETDLLRINYLPWVVPLGGNGLSVNTWFDVERITPSPVDTGNGAPVPGDLEYTTPSLAAYTSTFATDWTDPEGDAMTYRVVPLFGPTKGTLVLNATTGAFTYTPNPGLVSYVERFFLEASDTDGNSTISEVRIAVNGSTESVERVPVVNVLSGKKKIELASQTLSVPVSLSPAATPGDVYRINIKQEASDCDGNKFYHISCYDLVVSKC